MGFRAQIPRWHLAALLAGALVLLCLALAAVCQGAEASSWAIIVARSHSTLALKGDGSLWAWGWNDNGQLGLGDNTDRKTPTQVGSDTDWAAVTGGGDNTLALKQDGSLWAWGSNYAGELGLGDRTFRTTPTRVGSATDWTAVAAGVSLTLALKRDGSLWACGLNDHGQLGLGDTTNRWTLTQVGGATDWAAVACQAYSAMALKHDGSLWAWGANRPGNLGLGDYTDRESPTRVGNATDWAAISCGDISTLALKRDGTLWAWGWNTEGELGLGDTTDRTTPTRVGSDTDWSAVSCGFQHSLALKRDGGLWAWGWNTDGQLGFGDTSERMTPTRVGNASDWSAVSAGGEHSLALRQDGSLWAWGWNQCGQLGLGDTESRWVPTIVSSVTGPTTVSVKATYKHGRTVTVRWTAAARATAYRIWVRAKNYYRYQNKVRATSFVLTNLPVGDFSVEVRPYNASGEGPPALARFSVVQSYYVLFVNDTSANSAGGLIVHGHVALFFFTDGVGKSDTNWFFSYGSRPGSHHEQKKFAGNGTTHYVTYLTGKHYSRLVIFKVDAALRQKMVKKAHALVVADNYDYVNNNCLHQACQVLAVGDSYFAQWERGLLSPTIVPNSAFAIISLDWGLPMYKLKGFRLSTIAGKSMAVLPRASQ